MLSAWLPSPARHRASHRRQAGTDPGCVELIPLLLPLGHLPVAAVMAILDSPIVVSLPLHGCTVQHRLLCCGTGSTTVWSKLFAETFEIGNMGPRATVERGRVWPSWYP